ncbi:hypothetical protein K2173_013839 [Erythroxylum novogranatense]|uniref:Uncharacterized protein n=1 Tax=Erythroxylum novogranatense TaxID=1862640 RepID=A0AAV8SD02_9ROSI|nr:hypothetical protein K2173_013839 [Erythroxylum novogranatense]
MIWTDEDGFLLKPLANYYVYCCSPYSATILLSVPRQQNLTVKADLIFEEYNGLDCHKKLVLSKDRSSDTSRKHEYKRPSYIPPPEEAFIIDDADDAASFAPVEKLCNLTTDDPESSSMPSFKLIDEELGEDAVGTEIKKETDKILSEKTIFDHIREKAKSFPSISISTNGSSPSSKAFLLTKKRPREKDVDHELDAIEQIEASIILPQVKPNMGGPRQEGQYELEIERPLKPMRHMNADSSITMNFVHVSDGLPSETCEDMHQIPNKDTIFDHIRRKAENFPVLSRTTESDSPFWSKKQLSENRPELCIAAFETLEEGLYDKATRDATFIWEFEAGGKVKDIRRTEALTKVKNVLSSPSPRGNVTPTFSRMNSDPSSVEMLSFDINFHDEE